MAGGCADQANNLFHNEVVDPSVVILHTFLPQTSHREILGAAAAIGCRFQEMLFEKGTKDKGEGRDAGIEHRKQHQNCRSQGLLSSCYVVVCIEFTRLLLPEGRSLSKNPNDSYPTCYTARISIDAPLVRLAPVIECQTADELHQSESGELPIRDGDRGELFLAVDGFDK